MLEVIYLRHVDIKELLEESKQNISIIQDEYARAIYDYSLRDVLKPKVKSTLEHLRSCLDYIAMDIYELILEPSIDSAKNQQSSKIYFPYSKSKHTFNKILNKNLPNLELYNKEIYRLVEGVQPFKCKSNWLVKLCKYTNDMKHDGLIKQERKDKKTTIIPGLIHMEGGGTVTFQDSVYIRHTPHGVEKIPLNFTINNDLPLPNLDPRLRTLRINWIDFRFEGTDTSVLDILTKSYNEVTKLTDCIYKLL